MLRFIRYFLFVGVCFILFIFVLIYTNFNVHRNSDYTVFVQNEYVIKDIVTLIDQSIETVKVKLWAPKKSIIFICRTNWCYRIFSPSYGYASFEKAITIEGHIVAVNRNGANRKILTHELTHVATANMKCNGKDQMPEWLSEGIAVFVSDDERYSRANFLASAEKNNMEIDYVMKNNDKWNLITRVDPVLSYGAALYYVNDMVHKAGEDSIGKVIVDYCNGGK